MSDSPIPVQAPHGTVRWFGADWGAPVCSPGNHIATPLGMTCDRCDGEIDVDDQGVTVPYMAAAGETWKAIRVAWHLDCWIAEVTGDTMASDIMIRMRAQQ